MRTPNLAALAAVAALGIAGPALADQERVTFVENVRCNGAGVCEVQHKTIPMVEKVRARDTVTAGFCFEYTRRLTGFKSFPSLDPAVEIQMPQFEETDKRFFRCGANGSLASAAR